MDSPRALYQALLRQALQVDMALTQTIATVDPLRPQFFVTRQNGIMVPLVAVDELPSTLSIRDVPRTLTPHDISGMTGVGTVNARHRQYVVDVRNRDFQSAPLRADSSLLESSFAPADDLPVKVESLLTANRASVFLDPPKAYGIQEQPPSSPKTSFANMPSSSSEQTEEPRLPDLPSFHNIDDLPIGRAPGVKEYCSYWVRHGECDYAQQGCLYRHEMPLDLGVLQKIGLRDIPRWYREKHGLGSYLAGGNTTSGISALNTVKKPRFMERNWRSHTTEVLLEGTGRKPCKEAKLLTTSKSSPAEQRDSKLILKNFPPLVASIKDLSPLRAKAYPSPKSQSYGIVSRHQPFSILKRVSTSPAEIETISERQRRETILQLDAYEQRERDRLNEKYHTLTPTKSSITVPVNTPSTCEASSTTGADAETKEALEASRDKVKEAVKAAKAASVPVSPLLRPASMNGGSNGRKRGGRSRRSGRRREGGGGMDAKERMRG